MQTATLLPLLTKSETVRVKSEEEILATLDEHGAVDGVPFMPEMRRFCGQQFQVSRKVHKTCIEFVGMGSLDDVVFLDDLRCDGSAHMGCGRGCLLFWKKCWLQRMPGDDRGPHFTTTPRLSFSHIDKLAARKAPFFCQSTQLVNASRPLPPWDLRQYVADLRCGGFSLLDFLKAMFIMVYNKAARLFGKKEWKSVSGSGLQDFSTKLDLQPGELVRVRGWEEIEKTLDQRGRMRGLRFTPDMRKYCGGTFSVLRRLDRMILENTGEMREIRDTVILQETECDGVSRRLCPRRAYFFWREAWLERAAPSPE